MNRLAELLVRKSSPTSFYDLVGAPLFASDTEFLDQEIQKLYTEVVQKRRKTRRPEHLERLDLLERELAWATALLSDPKALAVYHRRLILTLWKQFNNQSTFDADRLDPWLLSVAKVDPNSLEMLREEFAKFAGDRRWAETNPPQWPRYILVALILLVIVILGGGLLLWAKHQDSYPGNDSAEKSSLLPSE